MARDRRWGRRSLLAKQVRNCAGMLKFPIGGGKVPVGKGRGILLLVLHDEGNGH